MTTSAELTQLRLQLDGLAARVKRESMSGELSPELARVLDTLGARTLTETRELLAKVAGEVQSAHALGDAGRARGVVGVALWAHLTDGSVPVLLRERFVEARSEALKLTALLKQGASRLASCSKAVEACGRRLEVLAAWAGVCARESPVATLHLAPRVDLFEAQLVLITQSRAQLALLVSKLSGQAAKAQRLAGVLADAGSVVDSSKWS